MSNKHHKHQRKDRNNPDTDSAFTAAFIRAFAPDFDTLGEDLSSEEIERLTKERLTNIGKQEPTK